MAFRVPTDYVNKVPRSTHNQSKDVRTTLHPGLAIPIYHDLLDLGESRLLDLSSLLQAEPFQAPYMGGFELRLHVFFDPLRNYYSWIDNNDKRTTEDILDAKKHRFDFPYGDFYGDGANFVLNDRMVSPYGGELVTTNPDFVGHLVSDSSEEVSMFVTDYTRCVVGKNSLASYLGIPSGTVPPIQDGKFHSYSLQPFLTYLNIWRCYYSNNQETVVPYTQGFFMKEQDTYIKNEFPDIPDLFLNFQRAFGNGLRTDIQLLDDLFKQIRYSDDGIFLSTPFASSTHLSDSQVELALRCWLFNSFKPYGGLLPVMYKPDMYRNLLSAEVGKLKRYVKIDPDTQAFSIQELRTENAFQRIIDRLDISGGRFSEWARTLWGVTSKKGIHIPDLLAVRSTFIGAENIKATATTESSEGATQLGQLASVIDSRNAFKPLRITASEPGTLMVVASLVPLVDYSQGLDVSWTRTNFADDYNPELQQLNWEDVPRSRYTSLPKKTSISSVLGDNPDWGISTIEPSQWPGIGDSIFGLIVENERVIGKQVPWIDKMTAVNTLSGEFDNDGIYSYWVGRRKYTRYTTIKVVGVSSTTEDTFTYYEPFTRESFSQYVNYFDWQYMFADQSIFKHNFFLQVGISQPRNKKPIGYRYMPSLER